MITKVTYRREVLISTKQYENTRICYEVTADVELDESREAVRAQLKRQVHKWIADDIYELRFGGTASLESIEVKRRQQLDAVVKSNGLGGSYNELS